MSTIKKLAMTAIPSLGLAASTFAAEGDIDLTAVEGAATKVQTALTSFFSTTLAPLVTAIGGIALGVYLIAVLFRWARKLGK